MRLQNSTTLFEVLPTRVMDIAMKMHDDCIRECLAKHNVRFSDGVRLGDLNRCAPMQGYESSTEGDAFILSFPDPMSALEFCAEVQMELLNMEWPGEVSSNCIMDGGQLIHIGSGITLRSSSRRILKSISL